MLRSHVRQHRQTVLVATIALVLTMVWSMAATADAIDDRANQLLSWVAGRTGYPADHVRVTVLVVEPGTIERIAYSGNKRDNPKPEALTVGQTIFLPNWFELGKNDDVLVHELTHVLQFASDARFPCRAAKEKQAYEVQSAFVDETGIGTKPDPFALFLLQCTSYAVQYESEKLSE